MARCGCQEYKGTKKKEDMRKALKHKTNACVTVKLCLCGATFSNCAMTARHAFGGFAVFTPPLTNICNRETGLAIGVHTTYRASKFSFPQIIPRHRKARPQALPYLVMEIINIFINQQKQKSMKKILTSLCATLLTVAATAQVAATISPSDKNVFTPSAYDYVSVTYGDTLTLSSAVATVSYGTASTTVAVDSTTTLQALFDISKAAKKLGVSDGDVITVSVNGVSGASPVSASYKYYTTLPKPTASPAAGSTLSSKTSSVTFTFSESLSCPYIQYVSGNVYNTDTLGTSSTKTVTAKIKESYWGTSAADITVSLVGVTDAEGYVYPPYEATYYYAETVNYLGVTPDPTTSTYQDAYDAWYVGFKFDKEIVMPESGIAATITFYDEDGVSIEDATVFINAEDGEVSVDYVGRAKYYIVNVPVPDVPEEASDFSYAVFSLNGFTYGGSFISQPSEIYYATLSSSAKTHLGSLTNINETFTTKAVSTVGIYSIQGSLIKANTSNVKGLAKGVYIVNGKKIIIR